MLIWPLVRAMVPVVAKSIASGPLTTYYRINSRGFGGNPATQVTLQEMYLVPQI